MTAFGVQEGANSASVSFEAVAKDTGGHPNQIMGVFTAHVRGRNVRFREPCTRWALGWFLESLVSEPGAIQRGVEFESEDGVAGMSVRQCGDCVVISIGHDDWDQEMLDDFTFAAQLDILPAFFDAVRSVASAFPRLEID